MGTKCFCYLFGKLLIHLVAKKPLTNPSFFGNMSALDIQVEFRLLPISLFALAPSIKQHRIKAFAWARGSMTACAEIQVKGWK